MKPSAPRPVILYLQICLGVGALAISLTGCHDAAKAPTLVMPTPVVSYSLPLEKVVRDWDEYTGHLQSPETANVQARVSGFIEQTTFKEGALVHKGDVLFVIDDRPFKAELDNKKANVAKDEAQVVLTQAELKRSEELLKQRAVSQQDFDTNNAHFIQAKAQLDADKAAVETASLNLEWTRVTAPVDGRVSRMYVTVGNLVTGGVAQATLLTTVVSVDPMYCYVPVPERVFLKYQAYATQEKANVRDAKTPCYLQLENETGFPHAGVIDFIDNSVDLNTGTIQIRGVIPNPTGALTPGVYARMRFTQSAPYKALLVPDVAVGTEQSERYLLVVGKDNVIETRTVKLGGLFGNLRAIASGLKAGEHVVVNGLQQARPGAKVEPREVPIPAESLSALASPGAESPDLSQTSPPLSTGATPTREASRP